MAKSNKFYITTAIDYVNASPHIGHAYEKVLADAIARWQRLKGKNVFFLTGTDENAQKNEQAAKAAGMETKAFVDKNSQAFIELCKKLNISNDDFIRTTETRHTKKVQEFFQNIVEKGDIYKGKYEGLYCIGCEAYKTEKELVDGKCPEHLKEPIKMSEDAYFFKLSKYEGKILQLAKSKDFILPEEKRKEIVSRIEEEGLKDLCVSRSGLTWGIDSPIDPKYKVYVWIDALSNYISALQDKEEEFWPADLHVIGKGINWFHTVIWPAILMSLEYQLPKTILVHGYLNLGGQKISKSLGNTIDPIKLSEKYQTDSIRYSLLRCSVFEDSDYSEEILIERHNGELANKLGNLISRVSTLAEKYGIEKTDLLTLSEKDKELIEEENAFKKEGNMDNYKWVDEDKEIVFKSLSQIGQATHLQVDKLMQNYEIDKALNLIFEFIDACNLFIQDKKPWEDAVKDKGKILYEIADSIKVFSILLSPFLPETAEKIANIFSFKISLKEIDKPIKESKIKKSEILFQKIETEEDKEKQNKEIKHNINKAEKAENIMSMNEIKYGDFQKLDLRVAKIENAEDIEGADKLLKLSLDVGELGKRTIAAGIKPFYPKDKLIGKKIIIIANLEPRNIKGVESRGMLLAASSNNHEKVVLLTPDSEIEVGSKIS